MVKNIFDVYTKNHPQITSSFDRVTAFLLRYGSLGCLLCLFALFGTVLLCEHYKADYFMSGIFAYAGLFFGLFAMVSSVIAAVGFTLFMVKYWPKGAKRHLSHQTHVLDYDVAFLFLLDISSDIKLKTRNEML
jgi:uncharacterized membrane protein